jgi:hypothetical protein
MKNLPSTHRILNFTRRMLSLSLQLNRRRLRDNALHRHLNEFVETVELLSDETLVVEVSVDDDPTSLLPQLIGDLLILFISVH